MARDLAAPVRNWAERNGVAEASASDREFLAAISLAFLESPDAYQMGRYLEDFYDWPVTQELITILNTAYESLKFEAHRQVILWVVANNIKVPCKKGDRITFRIGDVEGTGDVVDIIRSEARAVVQLKNKKILTINAEEILEVKGSKA